MNTVQDITSPMTKVEKRATASLAAVYGLRMLGLFLIMPVLSLFAQELDDSTPALVGMTIGIYGITQSVLQIPFGLLSDRFGRKAVIVAGLILFFVGSIVAALSTSIYGILLGRSIQGAGAIAGPIMALVADLTQEVHRTKAMALIGASIGMSFALAIVIAPILGHWIGIHGLFWLIAILSLLAMLLIHFVVPSPHKTKTHRDAQLVPAQFIDVLRNAELLRLNYGIFVLHAILTASFVIVPLLMRDAGLLAQAHWQVYLPVFLVSMLVMVPFVILAEKKRKMKAVFVGAIFSIICANLGFMQFHESVLAIVVSLSVFFTGFNLLEATLPSLVSKTAPGDLRGTAMGAYSTCQFLGAGMGGSIGGWCYGHYGAGAVFLLCALLATSWLLLALFMRPPRYWANLLISLEMLDQKQWQQFSQAVLNVHGVEEITLHQDDDVAYLKVDNTQLDKMALQELIARFLHQ